MYWGLQWCNHCFHKHTLTPLCIPEQWLQRETHTQRLLPVDPFPCSSLRAFYWSRMHVPLCCHTTLKSLLRKETHSEDERERVLRPDFSGFWSGHTACTEGTTISDPISKWLPRPLGFYQNSGTLLTPSPATQFHHVSFLHTSYPKPNLFFL